MSRLYLSLLIIAIILIVKPTTPTNAKPVDTFDTIPNVSVLAESSRVTSNQVAFGLTRGEVFKTIQKDTVTYNYSLPARSAVSEGGDTSDTLTIKHNLGYQPLILTRTFDPTGVASDQVSNGSIFQMGLTTETPYLIKWAITVDNTNIYIYLDRTFAVNSGTLLAQTGSIDIEYFLLEPARN